MSQADNYWQRLNWQRFRNCLLDEDSELGELSQCSYPFEIDLRKPCTSYADFKIGDRVTMSLGGSEYTYIVSEVTPMPDGGVKYAMVKANE